MTIKTINLQVHNFLTFGSVQNFVDNSLFTFDVTSELNSIIPDEENAIVLYNLNDRKDIFYSKLSSDDKVIWTQFVEMLIVKSGISRDILAQIIIQYEESRFLINYENVLIDNTKQSIIDFSELSGDELLLFDNYTNMITNLIL
jgi:hypothetical protein